MRRSSRGMLGAITGLAVTAMTLPGCATALDPARHHMVAVGAGAATVNPGEPIEGSPEGTLALDGAVSLHGTYARRLSASSGRVGLFGAVHGDVIFGGGLKGAEITGRRNLDWWSVAPALHIVAPVGFPVSLGGDAGLALVHATHDAGEHGPSASTTRLSPLLGLSIEFGLTPRVGWSIGGRWIRIPADDLLLNHRGRWVGSGAVSVMVVF